MHWYIDLLFAVGFSLLYINTVLVLWDKYGGK